MSCSPVYINGRTPNWCAQGHRPVNTLKCSLFLEVFSLLLSLLSSFFLLSLCSVLSLFTSESKQVCVSFTKSPETSVVVSSFFSLQHYFLEALSQNFCSNKGGEERTNQRPRTTLKRCVTQHHVTVTQLLVWPQTTKNYKVIALNIVRSSSMNALNDN